MPSLAQTAMVLMQIGVPYNLPRAVMQAAEEWGIAEAVQEVFQDPTFEKRQQMMMAMGPQNTGKGPQNTGKGQLDGVLENGGSPMAAKVMSPGQEANQQQQMPAGQAQSVMGFGGDQWQ